MAFFDPQEAFLAGDNGFFSARKGALRIKPAGVFVMSCVDGFYAEARKNIFLAKKVVKQFFTYFSMTRGASSYIVFIGWPFGRAFLRVSGFVQHCAQPERGYNAILFFSFPCRARLALYMDSSFLQAFFFGFLRSGNAVASIYPAC